MTTLRDKKLCLYHGIEFFFDGKDYFCSQVWEGFLEELSSRIRDITIISPVLKSIDSSNAFDYKIDPKKINVIFLPYFRTYPEALGKIFQIFFIFKKSSDKADIYWIKHPQPFSYILYFFAKKNKKRIFFQISGDVEEEISRGTKYQGPIRLIALVIVKLENILLKKIFLNLTVFIQSQALYGKFSKSAKKPIKIIPSSLRHNDFYFRKDTCLNHTILLLFVGNLNHEKNIVSLIKAFRIVKDCNISVKLQIIGDGPEKTKLRNLTKKLNIENDVFFYGHLSYAEICKNYYKKSDILILPSISEGTPRVILEAMARSLPVIATRVGGIPDLIEHKITGLLCDPNDVIAISDNIRQMILDHELRKNVIKNAFKFSQRNLLCTYLDVIFNNMDPIINEP